MATLHIGDQDLSLDQLTLAAGSGCRLAMRAEARRAVQESRRSVEQAVASGDALYGVNTGFGKLAGVRIEAEKLGQLQKNLLLSHATGVGDSLPRQVARLALALRIHNLARGASGVRMELLDQLMALYNADLVPVIPSQGSVGASGDLAPLAHMALPLIGQGHVDDGQKVITGRTALRRLGRKPLRLAEKEGLALINGTQIMTAIGILALGQARRVSATSDIACAMTLEALRGSAKPFQPRVHKLRPHKGQQVTAQNLRRLLQDSEVIPSHQGCDRVQDAYSMRCAPQVHGAAKEAIGFAERVLLTEAQSVTDNPLVFADGSMVSAGNFHGQPVSQALDFLAIGVATLANISERRIENLVNPDISGLPPFLAPHPGLDSGFMIPQVVAAALASENKTLAHPASVDTIPTSANREDHVSMGVTAARHAEQVVMNTTRVLAIELLCAAQGLDLGEPLPPGRGVRVAYRRIRKLVPTLVEDRYLAPDLETAAQVILDGTLLRVVEREVGLLVVTA